MQNQLEKRIAHHNKVVNLCMKINILAFIFNSKDIMKVCHVSIYFHTTIIYLLVWFAIHHDFSFIWILKKIEFTKKRKQKPSGLIADFTIWYFFLSLLCKSHQSPLIWFVTPMSFQTFHQIIFCTFTIMYKLNKLFPTINSNR